MGTKRLSGIQSLIVNGQTLAVEGSNGVTYNLDPETRTPVFDNLGKPVGYTVEYRECYVMCTIILDPTVIVATTHEEISPLGYNLFGRGVDGKDLTLTTFTGQVIRLKEIFSTEISDVDTSTGTVEVKWVGWPENVPAPPTAS